MKIGVSTNVENINIAQSIGFDYIEVNASGISALSDSEFEEKLAIVNAADIKCECFNILFPATIALFGDNAADSNELEKYLNHTFKRLQALGGKIAVFGSGRSRTFPQNVSFFDAYRKLVDIATMIGEIAAKYGLIVVDEPLNPNESNVIRTVAEGAMLVAQVNSENLQLLADGYHMFISDEPLDNIKLAGKLKHTHIATKDGRRYPTVQDELLSEFFAQLSAIGYDERISIEGRTDDFEKDAPAALAFLRKELS